MNIFNESLTEYNPNDYVTSIHIFYILSVHLFGTIINLNRHVIVNDGISIHPTFKYASIL